MKKNLETKVESDFWEFVRRIEQIMPASPEAIATTIGVELNDPERRGEYLLYRFDDVEFGALHLANLQFAIRSDMKFEGDGGFTAVVGRGCISLADIRSQVQSLDVKSIARGKSLEESTVWECQKPWGRMTYSFKERNPHCLYSIGFRP